MQKINEQSNVITWFEKIENAGGKVLVPKTKIIAGYISVFIDTEGNRHN